MFVDELITILSRRVFKTCLAVSAKHRLCYPAFASTSKLSFATSQDQPDELSEISKQNAYNQLSFNENCDETTKDTIRCDFVVINDFLREDEEKSLLEELEPYMKRLRYQYNHWDDAIHGYRETERLKWNENNTQIIQKVRNLAFPNASKTLSLVHVLDLSEDGYIKPHIDSVRFCGNIISGLSLLSDSIMRLVHDKHKDRYVDIFLKRRSLYIMKDSARYDYTHEILSNELSVFKNNPVKKTRRISVICRNEPSKDDTS